MRHFILQRHWQKGDLHAEDFRFPAYFADYFWGRPLPKKRQKAAIFAPDPKLRITDLVLGLFNFPIVTDKLKKIFADLEPANTEFQEVEILHKKKPLAMSWYVNVLNNVDCIDRKRSDLDIDPTDDAITKIRKLVLKPEAVQNRHAFRMQGFEADLVVSETFQKTAVAAKVTGVEFVELAKFSTK
jgi:uncharacterized protein DUF1629